MSEQPTIPPANTESVDAYRLDWKNLSFDLNDLKQGMFTGGAVNISQVSSPAEIIDRLNNDIARIQNDPLVQRIAELVGANPAYDAGYAPWRAKVEGLQSIRTDVQQAQTQEEVRSEQIASGSNAHLPNLKDTGSREI